MRSTSIALLLALAAFAAHAQSAKQLEWPRSFSGQPDFAFTRAEALEEAATRAKQANEKAPALPILLEVLNDDTRLDPLHLVKEETPSATTVTETLVSAPSTLETLMSGMLQLPTFTAPQSTDVTEFKAALAQAISSTVATWRPQAGRYSYGGLVRGLTLQAVVTSPQKYAVINGQRYTEGQSFQLRAPIMVPDAEIMKAMDAKTPAKGVLAPEVEATYRDAYEDTIAAFSAARNANPAIGQQMLTLPVVVKEIQPRKVILNVNGEDHELAVKISY